MSNVEQENTQLPVRKKSWMRRILFILAISLLGAGLYVMFVPVKGIYSREEAMDDTVKKLPVNASIKFKTKQETNMQHSLDDMTVLEQDSFTIIMLDLSTQAKFGAKRSTDGTVYTVTLYNTKESGTFQPDVTSNAVSKLQVINQEDDLMLQFTLLPSVVVNQIAYAGENSSKLAIKFFLQDVKKAEKVAIDVRQVQEKKTSEELSEEFYQKSLDLANAGNIYGAYEKSKKAIAYVETNHAARKMFILSALELGKREEAEKSLERGIFLAPNMLNYKKIRAKLLLAENKPQKALEVLLSQRPAIEREGDYYAFIAAVRQKLGDHKRAIKIYIKLLKIYPDEGEWWAGLGVSFDSLGDKQQALSAFKKSLEIGGLDIELQSYVEERVGALD